MKANNVFATVTIGRPHPEVLFEQCAATKREIRNDITAVTEEESYWILMNRPREMVTQLITELLWGPAELKKYHASTRLWARSWHWNCNCKISPVGTGSSDILHSAGGSFTNSWIFWKNCFNFFVSIEKSFLNKKANKSWDSICYYLWHPFLSTAAPSLESDSESLFLGIPFDFSLYVNNFN